MNDVSPQTVYLKDYQPAPYIIDDVFLVVSLARNASRITSRLRLRPNPASGLTNAPLILDGEKLTLESVRLNGTALAPSCFEVSETKLTIAKVPQQDFTLELVSYCNPEANTDLTGLYLSNGIFCTQCEAEGFRRITYFYDRPDVMARYKVRLEGPVDTCPVLLANGNPTASGVISGTGRHFAEWDDPFAKPSYLFALVAGDLAHVSSQYETKSGRQVELRIYVERGKEDRCDWAMESLKTCMRWDEERFGREYDLDVFTIVAVSHFNMGAMENKGLNIFNDKYILALPQTATDNDYVNIEAIIAHEYFHNWTGNRITCRDWFQLCLKEGLTVFRDQEFTSDIRSRAVKRIADVRRLRNDQFPEDGGPLAHPVRPSSYIEINNFYTATVYEKGAELCRMMLTLVGRHAFRRGMDLYFTRHDGQAVTIEDFVRCMAEASGRDFAQFFRWYEQAGTPEVSISESYDHKSRTYELTLEQVTAPTPGQADKAPLHMPLGIGLLGTEGNDMSLDLEGTGILSEAVIELTEPRRTFRFRNVAERPVLSLNRSFSAPVRLKGRTSMADRLFLMKNDSDTFNRWEAAQAAAHELLAADLDGGKYNAGDRRSFIEVLRAVLQDNALEQDFRSAMLTLPSEQEIAILIGSSVDPGAIHEKREALRADIGKALRDVLIDLWEKTESRVPFRPSPAETGRRSLRHSVLYAIAGAHAGLGTRLALEQLAQAQSMTDEIGALTVLVTLEGPKREEALDAFYQRHKGDHLIVDKWFALQAAAPLTSTLRRVRELMRHPDFKLATPNRVRSLIGTFAMGNPFVFHSANGDGYEIVADTILALDPLNPQVAARMATAFRSWAGLEHGRQALARAQLERILAAPGLSRDVFEIVSKSLAVSEQ